MKEGELLDASPACIVFPQNVYDLLGKCGGTVVNG